MLNKILIKIIKYKEQNYIKAMKGYLKRRKI